MLDFGALPPEVNSARMYAGPGSGPMMAAASAWDALAAQLELYAVGYSSVISDLQGQSWSGGAATAMASAAAPYVAWASATMTLAEQSAAQARTAAAAYEAAFAATVPPPVVAANRLQLAALVATNFFGQNGAAIAATEAQYMQMWAQDATAMYGYAAASSAASILTPFTPPPQTTNAGSQSTQAAAVTHTAGTSTAHTQATLSQLMSTLTQQLQTLATAGSSNSSATSGSTSLIPSSMLTAFKSFDTLIEKPGNLGVSNTLSVWSPGSFATGLRLLGLQLSKLPDKPATGAAARASGAIHGPVLASMGRATPVGKLSVPQSWTPVNTTTQVKGPAPLSGTDSRAIPAAQAHPPANALGGTPTARIADRAEGVPVLRNGRRAFKMPRPVFGG